MISKMFGEDEIVHYLQGKGYQVGQMPAHYINRSGPVEKDQETKVTVAFRTEDWRILKELYWLEDIEQQFGYRNVFDKVVAARILEDFKPLKQ